MPESVLQFGGQESFSAPPERVLGLVADLDALPRLMPDVESSQRVDEKTLRCVVRPGLSFLRGKLTATIVLDASSTDKASATDKASSADKAPAADEASGDVAPGSPSANPTVTMRIHSKGIGIEIVVETSLSVAPREGGGTTMAWDARVVEMRGLVATVSRPLIRAAAEQVIRAGWRQLRNELGETEGAN